MARLEDIDRRLLNWARWVALMQDGGRVPRAGTEARVDGEGWDAEQMIPTFDAEAAETGNAVMALPSVERAATEAFYLAPGGVEAKCRRLCCSESTLRARVHQARRLISQWLSDKREVARAERERVEKLNDAMRG